MEARRIIDGSAFGPEVLQVIRRAFDDAWRIIEQRFPDHMHADARKVLAKAVMSAARENSSDSAMIRDASVRAMRRGYPQLLGLDVSDAPCAKDA